MAHRINGHTEPQDRTPERTRDRIPGSRGAALGGEGPLAGAAPRARVTNKFTW